MSDSTLDTDVFPATPSGGVHRVLAIEARQQVSADHVTVYQFLLTKGFVWFRNITTENKKRHWKRQQISSSTRDWLTLQLKALKDQGFELTTEPFLCELNDAEYAECVTSSDSVNPRNLILRRNRVHTDRGVAEPTTPVPAGAPSPF